MPGSGSHSEVDVRQGQPDNDDTLRVYDLMGRRIEVENLSQLSSGLYIVNGVKTAIR